MKVKKFELILGFILSLLVVIVQAHLRITNIDMTEFRLLISYPLLHVISIVWLIAAHYLIKEGVR